MATEIFCMGPNVARQPFRDFYRAPFIILKLLNSGILFPCSSLENSKCNSTYIFSFLCLAFVYFIYSVFHLFLTILFISFVMSSFICNYLIYFIYHVFIHLWLFSNLFVTFQNLFKHYECHLFLDMLNNFQFISSYVKSTALSTIWVYNKAIRDRYKSSSSISTTKPKYFEPKIPAHDHSSSSIIALINDWVN